MVNRGKDFEQIVRKSFENVSNTNVIRLYDTMNGYSVYNPCDFVVYHYPYQYLIECKCCYGASLPIKNITDFQWNSLLVAENILGVVAGYMIWFIDKDVTVFVPASHMDIYVKQTGKKSFSYLDAKDYGIIINGAKKRTFWEYRMEDFINDIEERKREDR